jgi:hypothetical protein
MGRAGGKKNAKYMQVLHVGISLSLCAMCILIHCQTLGHRRLQNETSLQKKYLRPTSPSKQNLKPCSPLHKCTTARYLGKLRDKMRRGMSRIFGLPSSRIFSTRRSPTAWALAIFRSKLHGVRSSQVSACRMTRGPLYLMTNWPVVAETLRSTPLLFLGYLMTALTEMMSEVRALGVGVEALTDPTRDVN